MLASVTLSCDRQPSRPSFIVIVIDTLRSDFLGCYGFDGPVSPHLDALSRRSHLFRRAYAQAPWTKPSVASLFTSLYPPGHGVINHEGKIWEGGDEDAVKGVLPAEAITLAEAMQAQGYETAAVVSNPWVTTEYGFEQGFDLFDDSSVGADVPADTVLARAEAWLAARGPDRPYLLYLHLMDVHGPYLAPEGCYRSVRESSALAARRPLAAEELNTVPGYLRDGDWTRDRYATADLNTWRGRYAAGIRYVDDCLGPFLERLDEAGTLDEAFLVVTSDHGEELFEHRGWGHGMNLYEHQIHVPLIVHPPGGLRTGKSHDELVRLIDVLPTLLHLAGAPAPPGAEGEEFASVMNGIDTRERVNFACASTFDPALVAMNFHEFKLIHNARLDTLVVFNLRRDPGEGTDIAPHQPALAVSLEDHLGRIVDRQELRYPQDPVWAPLTDERREQLRALGYLN